jgi:hypothetical protein
MNKNTHLTVDDAREIALALVGSIPGDLTIASGIRWRNSKDLLKRKIRQILKDDGSRDVGEVLSEWSQFYEKRFNITKPFSKLVIPHRPFGLNRLVVKVKEVSGDALLRSCSQSFPIAYHPLGEFGDSLDQVALNDERHGEDYAFWVMDVTESELSPPENVTSPPGPCMTLDERLLLELKYNDENGGHLDTEKVTCCFGTRHSEGGERPVVCYRLGSVQVYWQANQFSEIVMSCSPYWSREMGM